MNYALNLAKDNRILSVTFEKYAPDDAVVVKELPEGNVADYRWEGEYIYDPIPVEEPPEHKPTQEERITELEEALALLLSEVTE